MAIRRRPLKPDPKGYFRPYLGFFLRVDPDPSLTSPAKKQPRFNLGSSKKEAPTEKPNQQYTPLKVRERVRELLKDGEPVSKIAEQCGVTPMTVYREQQRHQE